MPDDELRPPPPPHHPELTEEQHRAERGDEPQDPIGADAEAPPGPDPDPGGQPDPGHADEWREIMTEIGGERHPPRREQVYPYLMIRSLAAGDRGARPVYPPAAFWNSPDIVLMDANDDGAFDVSRLVAAPRAGRSYRVFVRVWNLGLVPALGVHVKGWAVNPGFIGVGNQDDPYYQQNFIGGRWLELSDRTRPECVAVAELDQTWHVRADLIGHHCLLAEVSCPLDPAMGPLIPNVDRHVAQRNVEVLTGSASPLKLVDLLGSLVPRGFTLEVTHAGTDMLGVLQAWSGGSLPDAVGKPREITVPDLDDLRLGVRTSNARHLLTAFAFEDGSAIISSERLAVAAQRNLGADAAAALDRPGGAWELIERLGPQHWADIGIVSDEPLGEGFGRRLGRLLRIDNDFSAALIARRLGGRPGSQHTLQFSLAGQDGSIVGGYTLVVA